MREYLNKNLKVIEKHLIKRTKKLTKLNRISIQKEFKEWNDPFYEDELIWTLPDLTRVERYNNFCRSIKKKTR
tara:strand:- start:204 stop:422 length:219 start_codon:yes stop_codon:yes gene_type:complete